MQHFRIFKYRKSPNIYFISLGLKDKLRNRCLGRDFDQPNFPLLTKERICYLSVKSTELFSDFPPSHFGN